MHKNEPEFHRKIIMSGKAHFHLGGHVNKQNCRIWGSENPKMIIEMPLYPQRVTVWCGFWTGGIIEPYFFVNQAEAAVLVNGLRYRTMINEFFCPELLNRTTLHSYVFSYFTNYCLKKLNFGY